MTDPNPSPLVRLSPLLYLSWYIPTMLMLIYASLTLALQVEFEGAFKVLSLFRSHGVCLPLFSNYHLFFQRSSFLFLFWGLVCFRLIYSALGLVLGIVFRKVLPVFYPTHSLAEKGILQIDELKILQIER